jgi:signal transduction histidine kinase
VIERHHGELAIKSEVGHGTRVTIRLPIEPETSDGGDEEAS